MHVHELRAEAEELLERDDFTAAADVLEDALAGVDPAAREPSVRLELLTMASDALRLSGRYSDALAFADEALGLAEGLYGSESTELAPLHLSRGLCCKSLGAFDAGRAAYRRALGILRRADESTSDLAADVYHNLASLELAAGRPLCGERLARRGIRLRRRLDGRRHPRLAADICALGGLLQGQGRLEEAEDCFAHALNIHERQPEPATRAIAITLHALASLAAERQDWPQAVRLYRRCVRRKRRAFGPDHVSLAISLHNLGAVRAEQGFNARAEALFEEAYAIFEERLGSDHPHTVNCRYQLEDLIAVAA